MVGVTFRVWDPGEDYGGDDAGPLVRARHELEHEVEALGGSIEIENHGVQAGDHVTLLIALGTLVLQGPAALESALELVEKLRVFLRTSRQSGTAMGEAAADEEALLLLAYAEVRCLNASFKTDPELVQVMRDGVRRHRRTAPYNDHFEGFPVGTFLFRIPDLDSGRTHIIEMKSNGAILDHRIRDELTDDAIEYVENEDASKQPE